MIVLRRALLAAVLVATTLGFAWPAFAQTNVSGPGVALDRYELTPGERVMVTMTGFQATTVTMSFCGNEARRGSIDCNMQASQAQEINQNGSATAAEMTVAAPPAPCPCIVRVSSRDNREIAVASVTIVGHPVADVVGGAEFEQPLSVDITAEPAATGISDDIRASLGGSRTYDVTIRVRNQGTFAIESVGVASTFLRTRYDDVQSIDVPSAGRLDAGVSWEQTVQVEVPALTFGHVEWSATASGAGPSVTSTQTTSQLPVLLVLLAGLLVADLLLLLWRLVVRIRRRRTETNLSDNPFLDEPDDLASDAAIESGFTAEHREPSRVG